jgi:hypothetical protein
MANYPYIVSEDTATLLYEGKPYTLNSSHANFAPFKSALVEGDFETAINYLDIKKQIKEFADGELKVENGSVYYYGTQLHGKVVDKLLELLESGLKLGSPFVKFVKNLLDNPSNNSVEELYDFLSYKSLPIDDDGYVIGYKGVCSDGWSKSGNTHTIVLQGEVNERGQIKNEVGDVIEVQRRSVDDNRQNQCSHGLHIGSFDYAKSWASDGQLLLVRFNPADAVSVPQDSECQKLRVCKYEILEEVEVEDDSEIKEPYYGVYTNGFGRDNEDNDYDEDYDEEEYEDEE